MIRPDETLIRDADLREKLEQQRGKFGFESHINFLIGSQKKRDDERAAAAKLVEIAAAKEAQLAALPRDTRRRAVIREVIETKPPSIGDMRHIHSILAICGLPYTRQPLDVRRFQRSQGQMSLVANAGELQTPDGGWEQQPLPFGPKARLLMMHLCSEAVRQKSAVVEIADSLTAFVREMGFNDSGGPRGALTAFKQQINALAACTLRIGAFDGTSAKTRTIVPFDNIDVWMPSHPDQRMLWPSTITFSDVMYKSLEKHALPVNAQAVRAFAGSARKLDLYFWLGHRLYTIKVPLRISWEALAGQFNAQADTRQGFARERAFRAQFVKEIGHIREVFPKLPVRLDESGLHLQPADPDVLALPLQRVPRKR